MSETVEWADVPQSEIDRTLKAFREVYPRAQSAWLVPCRYTDGTVTAIASLVMPYSNPFRQMYKLKTEWVKQA